MDLEKNQHIHPSTWDMPGFSCLNSRAIPSFPSQLKRRLDSFSATRDVPQDTSHNWRGNPCSRSHLEMRADSPASSREESQLHPRTSRGGLSHLWQLKRISKFCIANRDKSWVSHRKLRRTPYSPSHFLLRADSSAPTREVSQFTPGFSRRGLSHLWQLEGIPEFPITTQEKPWVSR